MLITIEALDDVQRAPLIVPLRICRMKVVPGRLDQSLSSVGAPMGAGEATTLKALPLIGIFSGSHSPLSPLANSTYGIDVFGGLSNDET